MIRAVLDTNVLVAGLLSPAGPPARILAGVAAGEVEPAVSPRLLEELRGVLARPKIARHVPAEDADAFVGWLIRIAVFCEDDPGAPRVVADADDDFLVALAMKAGSSFLVTGDAAVLETAPRSVRAIAPADFADLLDRLG